MTPQVDSQLWQIATSIASSLKDMLYGGLGGGVAYLYDYQKKKDAKLEPKFDKWSMVIYVVVGGFISHNVGSFLPIDLTGRDAYIGFSGASAMAIMSLVESKFAGFIFNRIAGSVPPPSKEKDENS